MTILRSAYALLALIAFGLTLAHALTNPSKVPLWIPVLLATIAMLVGAWR